MTFPPALPLLPAHWIDSPHPRYQSFSFGHSQVPWTLPFCLSIAGSTIQILSTFIRYSLFAALSGLMGESLGPYLPQITTLMLLSLRSTEGIVVSRGRVCWAN